MLLTLVLLVACPDTAQRGSLPLSEIDVDQDGFMADVDCDDRSATVNLGATETCNGVDDDCDGTIDEDDSANAGTWYPDTDGDGFGDALLPTAACVSPVGYVADASDCDDTESTTFPGADERCDAVDNNCDADIDGSDAVDLAAWYADTDGDGAGAGAAVWACGAPAGHVSTGDDCDDNDGGVHPGAPELCDALDQDCDGETRDAEATDAAIRYADSDGDGFGDASAGSPACDLPEGFSDDATDCDDGAAAVSPAADELCNGIDDDCDLELDEDDAVDTLTWYADLDADTFGDPDNTYVACAAPSGYLADATDCDDTTAAVAPDALERCNGLDDDCDTEVDEDSAADAAVWYADLDGDSYGDAAVSQNACSQPADFVADATDCDDGSATANPGAAEACNGADDDCDGTIDEPDAVDAPEWYYDSDGDGYGDASYGTACADPGGVVAAGGDCDDTSAAIHPGATETCDGTDTNCSAGETDALDASRWFLDTDGDSYGDPDAETRDCTQPADTVTNETDCDDSNGSVNPGRSEVCDNLLDDNCSGTADSCALTGAMTAWDAWGSVAAFGAGILSTQSPPYASDADGDGYDDLLVGNINDASGGSGAGGGLLFLGPVTTKGASASVTLVGENAGDHAGYRLVDAGLLGFSTQRYTAIAAPAATVAGRVSAGSVYIFEAVPTGSATLDLSLAPARVDGDAGSSLGSTGGVTGAGDTDGDGAAELLVGESSAGSVSGMVGLYDVFAGGSYRRSDASWTVESTEANDNFGAAAAAFGDDDGDGYEDFLVSAPYSDVGGANGGAVYLFNGPLAAGATIADATAIVTGNAANPGLGTDLSVGDLDGDGNLDILAGAHSSAAAAYVVLGPFTDRGTLDATAYGHAINYYYNGFVGDVDADGADDVTYAYYYGFGSGTSHASLSYGPSVLGTGSTTGWRAEGYQDGGSNFTLMISSPGGGDVNGDGYSDMLVPVEAVCATPSKCGGLGSGDVVAIQFGHGG